MIATIIEAIVAIVIVLGGLSLIGTGAAFILSIIAGMLFNDEREMEDRD